MRRIDTTLSRSISKICFALLVAVAIATGVKSLKAQERSQEPNASGDRQIVILVEEGSVLPAQYLGKFRSNGGESRSVDAGRFLKPEGLVLPEERNREMEVDVTFSLTGGSARFDGTDGPVTTVPSKGNIVSIPAIKAGTAYDESFLSVIVDGQPLAENLKVATLPAGSVQILLRYVPVGDPSLITLGENYAVIDENKLSIETNETISGEVHLTEEAATLEGRSPEIKTRPQRQAMTAGVCIRPLWPLVGIINWNISNPQAAGYSYKPEGPKELIWASAPQDEVDGIYNKNWGCGKALKIPSHCTVTWNASSYSYCCNIAGILRGKGVVRWVTPGSGAESTWEKCPLK